MARACIFRRVYSKRNANSQSGKRIAQVSLLKLWKLKCKKAYLLKYVKAHQKSVQETEQPENESSEEM